MPLDTLHRKDRISEDSAPAELIEWMLERFAGGRMLTTTAFGMEGCALIDMIAGRVSHFTVAYIDTGFLFPETLELRDRLARKYPHLDFVAHYPPLTSDQQTEQYGGKLWESNPDACCRMRKIIPMAKVLRDVDVWVTGLRRSQSSTRSGIKVVEWNWPYQVIKVNPLASWERKDVWAYVQAHDVPYNPLHEQGYPSIGCAHCTSPVEGSDVTTYTRQGRWNKSQKTECGLHGEGI